MLIDRGRSMPLALFDVDDTLIDGDAASLWSRWMVSQQMVQAPGFLQCEAQMMDRYAQGELDMADYMAFTLQPITGKTAAELDALTPGFIDSELKQRFYGQGLLLIRELQQAGYRVVFISATAEFLVEAIARHIGVEDVLAIQLEYDAQGRHTGNTVGTLSYREGKVTRLREWLVQQHESLAGARFYSDSSNDLPLLELVECPVAINPDARLRAVAQSRNWPVFDWSID
jgi:HAD superfamily hydrolase (TIGR01490 family)